jgi:hypothetical protein
MKGTEKKRSGPVLVLGMVVLSVLGAGLTWRNYIVDHPSAQEARIVAADAVRAEFSAAVAARLEPGTRAIISCRGVRRTGYVEALPPGACPTTVRLKLLEPFENPPPDAPCEVTVDLTVPPKSLEENAP